MSEFERYRRPLSARNKPYEEWLGHPAEEIIGKTAGEFLENATEVQILAAAEKNVLETGQVFEREVRVPRPDGIYYQILIKYPIWSVDRSISGHRMAAEGMPFPWRLNRSTISANSELIWEMSPETWDQ